MRRHPGGADRRGDDGYRSCRPLSPPPRPDRQELRAASWSENSFRSWHLMSPDWKLGFHQGSSLARETYGGLAPLVLFRAFHAVAKAIVSEDRDGLHSIGDHDVWIV